MFHFILILIILDNQISNGLNKTEKQNSFYISTNPVYIIDGDKFEKYKLNKILFPISKFFFKSFNII